MSQVKNSVCDCTSWYKTRLHLIHVNLLSYWPLSNSLAIFRIGSVNFSPLHFWLSQESLLPLEQFTLRLSSHSAGITPPTKILFTRTLIMLTFGSPATFTISNTTNDGAVAFQLFILLIHSLNISLLIKQYTLQTASTWNYSYHHMLSHANSIFKSFSWWIFQAIFFLSSSLTASTPS